MKKIQIVLITLFLTMGIIGFANAQEEQELPEAGITPDSAFYFFDKWGDSIGLFFAFGEEAKAEKQLFIAQERLAEVKQMEEEGETEAMEEAVDQYGGMVSAAAENVAKAAKSGEGSPNALNELLISTASVSQGVLGNVYEKVPEQAKGAIEKAMQSSARGMEEAVKATPGEQQQQVQQRVNNELQKAREIVPGSVKQHIPSQIQTQVQIREKNNSPETEETKEVEEEKVEIKNEDEDEDSVEEPTGAGANSQGNAVQNSSAPKIR